MIKLFIPLLFAANLFALSPFSLEEIKSVNFKMIDKSKLISKQHLDARKSQVEMEMKNLNIQTKSEHFSNLIIKIQAEKLDHRYVLHISMFIVEESSPIRNKEQENMSITYYRDDFFSTNEKDINGDLKESIIDYLLNSFIEQYKEEN
jgi:hypothetical protein